jgi:membrane protein YdbS with pleckstrin-like domain
VETRFDAAFDAPGETWTGVSPKLAVLRRWVLLATGLPVTLALAALLGWQWWWAGVLALVIGLAACAWGWVLVGRNVRSWAYTERVEDLLIRRGVLFRQLVVVPYGRMQFVDVEAGPLHRAFGLATIQLHTAAASTDAQIPGLLPAEAARLRDRLAVLGETQSAGL